MDWMISNEKYEYNICTAADKEIFDKQCAALEKHIPGIERFDMLTDVDGSQTQIYELNGKKIIVHNSYYIDAVYIDSEVELTEYFK